MIIASLLRDTDEDSLSEIMQYPLSLSVFITFKGTKLFIYIRPHTISAECTVGDYVTIGEFVTKSKVEGKKRKS